MHRKHFLTSATALFVGGCGHDTSTSRFGDLGKTGEPLRSTFNHDVDKVRIVMLVSPT
jgi:hypothetical protein